MTFTDAVKELAEGRCEGIERKGVIVTFDDAGFFIPRVNCQDWVLADDWQLVGVKPQVEEVPDVAYRIVRDGQFYGIAPNFDALKEHIKLHPKDTFHELKGTYLRPVRRKVKRRERIALTGNSLYFTTILGEIPSDAKLFAEWIEESDQ